MFFITDGFITNKFKIELAFSLISKLENESIDLIAIGVGLYSKNINLIFPECCSFIKFLSRFFNIMHWIFIWLFWKGNNTIFLENSYIDYKKLKDKIGEDPIDLDLIKNIEVSPAKILNMIVNEDFIEKEIIKIDKEINNPNAEPYYDSFSGHSILVIILKLWIYW